MPDARDAMNVLVLTFLAVFACMVLLRVSGAGSISALGNAVIVAAVFLGVPLMYTWVCRYSFSETYRLNPCVRRSFLLVILSTLIVFYFLTVLYHYQEMLLKYLGVDAEVELAPVRRVVGESLSWGILPSLFLLAVVPAVAEEFFFRGFLLSSFSRSFGPVRGLIYTSLFFGVFHVSLPRMIMTFLLGLFFGLCVMITRSLWASITAHLLNNGITIGILWYARSL